MNTLFIEKITLFSLLWLMLSARSFSLILYFDPPTRSSLSILLICRKIGFISGDIRRIDYHIGQIKNDQGASEYTKLLGYARELVNGIKKEIITDNPLFKRMASIWRPDKVEFYFERIIEQEMTRECLRIGMVDWLLKKGCYGDRGHSVLMVRKGPWHTYLAAHAKSHGIRLLGYRASRRRWVLDVIPALALRFRRTLPAPDIITRKLLNLFSNAVSKQRRKPSGEKKHASHRLAIRYYHRKLGFKDNERTEFFWLNGTDIPSEEIILYDYVTNKPFDPDTLKQIHEKGIEIMGQGPGIRQWHSTINMYSTAVHTIGEIFIAVLQSLIKGKKVSMSIFMNLVLLAVEYAHWYDFYKSNMVRINVTTSINTSVAQVLAMDRLNGISMAYQYTASNLLFPISLLSAGENVQFVFSPLFERMWKSIGAPVDRYVHTGFIYDGAISAVCNSKRTEEIRARLHDSGAEFVICFFDENSVNRWEILASDEDAARDYEYLLQWLLSDEKLGIVFKPKNSTNLYQRLSTISELIKEACETGRCLFLTSDTLYGSIYPAEAASIADLCIGKLLGATVSLEAFLAGKPTLLIDSEGFHDHPFQLWGRGRVIFDDWDSIRHVINHFRSSPDKNSRLGDWSPNIWELDPFQDGQAGLRMGSYISSLYNALKRNIPRQDAMTEAAEVYATQWGENRIRQGYIKNCSFSSQ